MSTFTIERAIGYTSKQTFVVVAEALEDAIETLEEFCESDWSSTTAQTMGVAQIDSTMEQDGEAQQFQDVKTPSYPEGVAEIQFGLMDDLRRGKAGVILDFLTNVAGSLADGVNPMEVHESINTFLSTVNADLEVPSEVLRAVVAMDVEESGEESAAALGFSSFSEMEGHAALLATRSTAFEAEKAYQSSDEAKQRRALAGVPDDTWVTKV